MSESKKKLTSVRSRAKPRVSGEAGARVRARTRKTV